MTDTIQAKGSCLCGKVSFTAKQLSPKVGVATVACVENG